MHKHHSKANLDPKMQAIMEKQEKRDHRVEHIFRRILHLLEQAIADGNRVAVPKCYGEEMRFIYIHDFTAEVAPGYANIPEPIADGPVADDPTALVLMPGLAFDPQGHRCGYGGGFYDKFLAAEPNHPTLALCYEFQMLPHLETEAHDIPVDYVLWA